MQRWQCHKVVDAFKIDHVLEEPAGGTLYAAGEADILRVNLAYMAKHQPVAGGYYVRYEDGYESFSPAAAFEAGYTLLGDPT